MAVIVILASTVAAIAQQPTSSRDVAFGPSPATQAGSRGGVALTPDKMPAHPFMMFGQADIPVIAKRKDADELLGECWEQLVQQADAADRPVDQEDDYRGWWSQLEARAFVARITGDKQRAEQAIGLLMKVAKETDPERFYDKGGQNFHSHAAPLRALALAWDWLYGDLTPEQRSAILPGLEKWCDACFTFTDKQWWREASYNVGSIPIGGLGILSLAILGDSQHPKATTWYREATRRIGQNFFPTSWKPSGICWEGPNYAIVGLKYPALFAEALRRAGGPDFMASSGARHAMQYLMHQWMPQGSCAPIGDNTSYGRRTFAAEYLLGLALTRDPVGLWTWRTHTDTRRLDELITYLWYPLDLEPVSPAAAKVPPAKYFEVTQNRAGYFFARTSWDDPDAAFFAFVTRHERCNHQHYDMNSFLLGAFGTLFATHDLLFPYGHENHGVDFEHNLIVVDEGGWPRHDSKGSCGDSNSTEGTVVGLATGPFADYLRGDAKWSYRDNSIIIDNPAIRAERACLFVKAGPTPYMVALDDIQFSNDEHDYKWQWHAPDKMPIEGKGTTTEPLVLRGEKGSCAIHFLTPAEPNVQTQAAPNVARRRAGTGLQRIVVAQNGVRVQVAAVATLQADAAQKPIVEALPVECRTAATGAARVQLADGTVDVIAWQSEEDSLQRGLPLAADRLRTDGLAALVRVRGDKVVGYLLGEGTYLKWGEQVLVQAPESVCVTADAGGAKVFGRRRAREGLPTVEPIGVQAVRPTGEALLQAARQHGPRARPGMD